VKNLNLEGRKKGFVDFYDFAEKYRSENGGIFDFRRTKTVLADGCKCRGYYEGETKKIVVSINNADAEPTFVHEFCHFMQDVEQDPIYTKSRDDFWWSLDTDKWKVVDWDSVLDYIALERDCELRVIEFSQTYNLFNNKKYAQNTNAYLYFYQYVFLTNHWPSTHALYNSKLTRKMPNTVLPLEKFEKIDMDVMKEYAKYFD
jgi:hypothetical protein